VRRPAADQRRSSPTASRTSRVVSTLPGRAIAVMRLARLTGRPYQSPPRLSASPDATPTRSWGKSSPSASEATIRSSATSTSGPGSGETNMAASPIVLIRRTSSRTTSAARRAMRSAVAPSCSGATSSPSRVKPTRSAKQTVTSRAPGNEPRARSAALIASVRTVWRRCMRSIASIIGPIIGSSSATRWA